MPYLPMRRDPLQVLRVFPKTCPLLPFQDVQEPVSTLITQPNFNCCAIIAEVAGLTLFNSFIHLSASFACDHYICSPFRGKAERGLKKLGN